MRRALAVSLFILLIADPAAAKSLRLAFSGTSITCGTGTSTVDKAFPALVAAELERRGSAVAAHNACVGGAVSLAQLVALKRDVLPLNPDLLIIEAGTLDRVHDLTLGPAALESMVRLARAAAIPVLLFYPFTDYAALPARTVASIASRYGVPLLDISAFAKRERLGLAELSTDRVHANDRGHALIAAAIVSWIDRERPFNAQESNAAITLPRRTFAPDLDNLRFVAAKDVSEGAEFLLQARFAAMLFHSAETPLSFTFRVNGGRVRSVTNQPGWLITHPLLFEQRPGIHRVELDGLQRDRLSGFLID